MTNIKKLLKLTLSAAAFGALSAGSAYAAGTAADTNVQNTFTLDYKVGGTDQPTIDTGPAGTDTPTEFTVDRLIDLTVASNGNTTVAPGAVDEELVFSVTNTGNDTQGYILSLANQTEAGAADDHFNPSGLNMTIYTDAGGDGVFTPGVDDAGAGTTYVAGTATPDLAPDAVLWIVVDGDIPTTVADPSMTDGDTADVSLIADTAEPGSPGVAGTPVTADLDGNSVTGAAENVLADGENDVPYDNENVNQGDHSATGTYIVASADLVAAKVVGIVSEDGSGCTGASFPLGALPNAGHAVPGACIEYRITVQNTGTTAATDLELADILPDDLRFVEAAQNGFTGGTFNTPAANTDCAAGACTVELTSSGIPVASLAAATTGTIVIRATIK